MADLTRIQFKRSKTPNVRPAPDTVAEGEIILNLADRAILTKLGNEIIDLGFAKGGKVDGNIDLNGNFDQKNGNIVTTGSITVNQESTINAPFSIKDSIKIKDSTKPDNFAALTYYTGKLYYEQYVDGKWTGQFIIPQGSGTAASREWVNTMVQSSGNTTYLRNPTGDRRLCLIAKNTGEAGAYDYANNRWAFIHNQADMSIYGHTTITSDSDYTNIKLKKSDGRYVQIETKPHAGSNDMLTFAYKQADGTNQHVMQLPYETGTIASREWTNTMVKALDNGVSLASPRGYTEIANNDNGNMGFWDRTNKRWVFVVGAQSGANFAGGYVRIKNALSGGDQSSFEATSPDGGKKIGLWAYNDGRTLLSAWNGEWSNITIGGVGNGTIALREWVNVWLRNGGANTETILQARENPGESFMFLRSNDHNIGFSLKGSTKFRITPTAITTETGLRTFAINGTDNSINNRPQIILDSKADLWRIEPDGAGKLQLTHPSSGALYEFEKVGGTQQVASKQWVNSQGFLKNGSQGTKLGGLNYGSWVTINSANDQKYVATQAMVQLMTSVPDNAVFVKCQNQNNGSTMQLRTVYRYITQL